MTDNHPITPPPELVMQWVSLACDSEGPETWIDLATQAACWGADQELEACCDWLIDQNTQSPKWFDPRHEACALVGDLRAARRPKPPSLKEQALSALDQADRGLSESEWQQRSDTIRRALEALPD